VKRLLSFSTLQDVAYNLCQDITWSIALSPAHLSDEQLNLVRAGAQPFYGVEYYECLWETLKGHETMTNASLMDAIKAAQRQVLA
jgi:hypothetical protein